ncbi:hypothetical protein QYF61_010397 [Mycteria americana]|uniref:Uncharacterized protein n=1 Tax=Mycteria americana TaxID=33587 RepID=A0AAN7MKU2_MYCAM|nr:hypothetical protein QYF61_010397 [Mycteria americana]
MRGTNVYWYKCGMRERNTRICIHDCCNGSSLGSLMEVMTENQFSCVAFSPHEKLTAPRREGPPDPVLATKSVGGETLGSHFSTCLFEYLS